MSAQWWGPWVELPPYVKHEQCPKCGVAIWDLGDVHVAANGPRRIVFSPERSKDVQLRLPHVCAQDREARALDGQEARA